MKAVSKSLVMTLLAGLLVAGIIAPARAQETPATWFAYLYNWTTNEVMSVDLNSQTSSYLLDAPPGFVIGSHAMAFTPDGAAAAYCLSGYAPDGTNPSATLYLREVIEQRNRFQLDLGPILGCTVGKTAFSTDYTRLGVGIIRYFVGDPNADTSQPGWQLLIMDATTGAVLRELNAQSASMLALGLDPNIPFLPQVAHFAGNEVTFIGIPYGTEGGFGLPAYRWNLDTDAVETVPFWGESGVSFLQSTGEIAWLAHDPNLPAGEPGGPSPLGNIVKVAGADGVEQVVFHSPDWVIIDTEFVNGGAQLAILLLQPFDAQNMAQQSVKWILLDRSGGVVELQESIGFVQIASAPDGAVMLWSDPGPNNDFSQPVMLLDYIGQDGSRRELLRLEPDPNATQFGVNWELAFSAPVPPRTDLTPFQVVTP